MVEVFKEDYRFQTQEVLGAIQQGVREGSGQPKTSGLLYLYLPNQTRRIVAQYHEQLIATSEAPYWRPNNVRIQPVAWWNVLQPNLLGRMTIDVGGASLWRYAS